MKAELTFREFDQLLLWKSRADRLNREIDEIVEMVAGIMDERAEEIPNGFSFDLIHNQPDSKVRELLKRAGVKVLQ